VREREGGFVGRLKQEDDRTKTIHWREKKHWGDGKRAVGNERGPGVRRKAASVTHVKEGKKKERAPQTAQKPAARND